MSSTIVLAAEQSAEGIGFGDYLPPIIDLFEFPAFAFEDTLFAFNRTAFLYLLAALITVALAWFGLGRSKVVPGKFQSGMESMVDFVRDQIIQPIIGPEGMRYLPMLFTMFLFILVNNVFEITPFINFPTTSRMALPALLSFTVYFVFIFVGIKAQGVKYFWNAVAPPGLPWFLYILVVPIEIVSTFVVRPFTLAVRLFANLMAGHILLSVVFLAASYNFIDFTQLTAPNLAPQGALPFVIGIFIVVAGAGLVLFELLVSVLQAYIFTALAAVYISGSMSPDH